MEYVTDLHLHSRYSRAVSPSMDLFVMSRVAQQKGLHILSASDFTHPLWFKEISEQLEETAEGLYQLKSQMTHPKSQTSSNNQIPKEPYFMMSTEISSIYTYKDKLRRIHNLVFAPNLDVAAKINNELAKRGANLQADGRPIVGISARDLLELILEQDKNCMIIPCHVWTPHFGVYGSKSGFDSLEDCFGDLAPYVYGIETGISSDPEMNWRIKELSNRSILSFSDAHSPTNMGRESTVFELEELAYENIRKAIMRPFVIASKAKQSHVDKIAASPVAPRNDKNRIAYTIEFYPEEGKYHFSGHRFCKVSMSPEDVWEKGTLCPVCRRTMTEGVALRIEQLAGKETATGYREKVSLENVKWYTNESLKQPPYVKLIRLIQIVAQSIGSSTTSKKTITLFETLENRLGSELTILLKTPIEDIRRIAGERISDGIDRVRKGQLTIEPGYDGEYGKVTIFDHQDKKEQMGLF